MELLKELHQLLLNHVIWGPEEATEQADTLSTGFKELDEALPGGGWARSGLTEIQVPREGANELSVLLPALAKVTQDKRWVVFVAPPYHPYAPALAQAGVVLSRYMLVKVQSLESRLWEIEQSLRSGDCGAVVFWADGLDHLHLRRLHLAAMEGNAMAIGFHHAEDKLPLNHFAQVQMTMRPIQGARVQIDIVNIQGNAVMHSLALALTKGNPVLSTPLPPTPSRGRIARTRKWNPKHKVALNQGQLASDFRQAAAG